MRLPIHASFALAVTLLTVTGTSQANVWQPLLPFAVTAQPQARRCAAMAYDPGRDRIVMCAGRINSNGSNIYPQETWEFDGVDWRLIGPVGPVAVGGYDDATNVSAYYDVQNQAVFAIESVIGGSTNFLRWNGATWTTVLTVPSTVFPPRYAFTVAYDVSRGVAVLFGGHNGSISFGDTWEFNGTSLAQVSGFGPPVRWGHAMAYDSARNKVVIYGGRDGPQLADMWDWNGISWQPTPNASGPGARSFHALAYDARRARLVLFGNNGTGSLETWEWQPSGWTLAPAVNAVRSHTASVYDSLRQRIVAYGGTRPTLMSGPTATFGLGEVPNVATMTSFGVGCAGPSGVPQLQAVHPPVFGSTLVAQVTNVPPGPLSLVFGWVGFDNAVWNGNTLPASLDPLFPGCTAYLAPVASYWLGGGTGGTQGWTLPIPFMPGLSGLQVYLQSGVYVPNFNPGQVVFTNALVGTLGS